VGVEENFAGEPSELLSDFFRAVNDRIRELKSSATGECDFVCECDDEACMHVMHLTIDEYDTARHDAEHFVVLPGHHRPGSQHVVTRNKRFVLVKVPATNEEV
jgi:hypothetical protein